VDDVSNVFRFERRVVPPLFTLVFWKDRLLEAELWQDYWISEGKSWRIGFENAIAQSHFCIRIDLSGLC
jgi:hypothetical protein